MRWQRRVAGLAAAAGCLALLACLVTLGVLLQGSDGYGRRLRLALVSSTAGAAGERPALSQVHYSLQFRHTADPSLVGDASALVRQAFASAVVEGTVLSESVLADAHRPLLSVAVVSEGNSYLRPGSRILLARDGVTIPPHDQFLEMRAACGLRVVGVEPSRQANAGVGAIVWLELTDEQVRYQQLVDARPWVPVVLPSGDCKIKEPPPTPAPTVSPSSTPGPTLASQRAATARVRVRRRAAPSGGCPSGSRPPRSLDPVPRPAPDGSR